ncbi:Lactation elevated protein 1 [Trametes pubescens]|uniref:Arabinogalactan endo-beta-1,4-galactanase n=1 Tax=Trametes pubescens TaxID=154538 RepID=A0A1M2VCW0_TRAPU|nr:Lactation elevated protein 1 [Trametes pubescens]
MFVLPFLLLSFSWLASALMYKAADISSLALVEKAGIKYTDGGKVTPFETIIHNHGANTVRIRVWTTGDYNLQYGLALAKRVKAAGLTLVVDLHYSDTSLRRYTKDVVTSFSSQGTPIDILQVGNEINGGLLWPVGQISSKGINPVSQLLHSAINGAKAAGSPKILIHLANGWDWSGLNSFFGKVFIQGALTADQVDFIGVSFYPFYDSGATLAALKSSLTNLANTYKKPIVVAETDWPVTCTGAKLTEPSIAVSTSGQQTWVGDIKNVLTALPNGLGQERPNSPLEQYYKLVESGTLRGDDHQERIIGKLQRLHDDLLHYEPHNIAHTPASNSLISRLFTRQLGAAPVTAPTNAPKGLYLYGDVGTGKTMLMDLFYHTLPPHIKRKRRVHFHAFMIDVHKRVHAMKAKLGARGGDPIEPVARDLAQEAYVLCFDEFQVTDIADAMILRQLFEKLMNFGVVCVITSNRHPDELYKNGIQRQNYRRIPRTLSHVYYDPLTPENQAEFEKLFKAFASHDNEPITRNRKLHVWGREVAVPQSTPTVAKFGFLDLCGKPMSAADYIEITKTFGTIFVTDVPKMGLSQKDMAREYHFCSCYESKTKLFISSEVPIFQIFSSDPNAKGEDISDHMRSVMDDLGLSSDIIGASSMFTGDEELFAFARCCSRLVQMGSKEWAETAGVQ